MSSVRCFTDDTAGFRAWLQFDGGACHSVGNGSAVRVSPVGWAFDDEQRILRVGEQSAIVTHDRGVAHAFHGDVPEHVRKEVQRRLPQEFLDIIGEFSTTYL